MIPNPIGTSAENATPRQRVLSTAIQRNRTESALGSAGVVLLLLFLLLAALGAGAWMLFRRAPAASPGASAAAAGPAGPTAAHPDRSPSAPTLRDPQPASVDLAERERPRSEERAGTNLEAGGGPPPSDPGRFRGDGVLRGRLLLPEDAALPGPWTLVVGPSRWLVGSERATTRRIERAADERDFRVEGLPLAGYRLDVEVAGWTARAADVLLERGAEDVFVTLELDRNGFVEGSLFRVGGVAAEGIPVRLEPLAGGEGYEATVDIGGSFRFEGVPEGNWRLSFGPEASPLLAPTLLEVDRGGMRLPPATLPPLSWFRLVVLDAAGTPIAGAEVSASGTPDGVSRGETDEYGVFVGRDALPGRWTARVTHPEHGTVRRQFVVRLDEPFEDTVTLER